MHESIKFQHYIFTRFNYPDTYEHTEERIKIFRDYTLPSVLGQTDNNFKWLITVNPNQDHLFDFIDDDRVKLINSKNEVGSNFVQYIKNDFDSEYLITTRLDNDDLLRRDSIETKMNIFLSNPEINLIDSNGYRMDRDASKMVEFSMYQAKLNSPFSTAIKKITSEITYSDTVYSIKHGHLYQKFKNVEFIKERMWIQLIHKTNKLNKGMNGRNVSIKELAKFIKR